MCDTVSRTQITRNAPTLLEGDSTISILGSSVGGAERGDVGSSVGQWFRWTTWKTYKLRGEGKEGEGVDSKSGGNKKWTSSEKSDQRKGSLNCRTFGGGFYVGLTRKHSCSG